MQTCTGPIICDTQRRGKGGGVEGKGGWSELLFCILVRERRYGIILKTGVKKNEKKRFVCYRLKQDRKTVHKCVKDNKIHVCMLKRQKPA